MIQRVEGNVAAVDDEVGPVVVDVLTYPMEVLDEFGKAGAEMRVADLRKAEAGHGGSFSGANLHSAHVSEMAWATVISFKTVVYLFPFSPLNWSTIKYNF
ncbi:MAG: hypothetical protein G4V63_18005 [Candidatus Afipia apatlaquensis]|uniref:Uncharacterized protein n=1 Tax=Candidatus Afipia apatlaquensis TaxID=2712852 RepID=A0A7C9VPG5_9BRAD|nr:hypothetical protein [Candidatus Afipia apatlaquensis]